MKESLVAKALRGFFILLPFLIAYLMIGQLVNMILALTQPLFDLTPGFLVRGEGPTRLALFGVLIVICLLVAQIADTPLAQRLGSWFESAVMSKFPPYAVLKSLAARLSQKQEEKLQPALLKVGDDARMLVAIVEQLSDGRMTVFAPMSPTPGLGVLQIVHADKLELLRCPMSAALRWNMNWGFGTEALLEGVRDGGPGHEA
jgi:uncharacterized membrane protein